MVLRSVPGSSSDGLLLQKQNAGHSPGINVDNTREPRGQNGQKIDADVIRTHAPEGNAWL